MRARRVDAFRPWMIAVMLLLVAASAPAVTLPAKAYERHAFTESDAHEAIQKSGDLSGGRLCIGGWMEYRVDVEAGGYKLWTHGAPPSGVEFAVDPDAEGNAPPERYFFQREYPNGSHTPVGNVWLAAGTHRIRLTRYYWTG